MVQDIRERTFEFAVSILRFSENMMNSPRSIIIAKQLIRAGTSIGANVQEATAASSRVDFAHKMGISLREARETLYWLRIVKVVETFPSHGIEHLLSEADQIMRILGAIVSSTRGKRKPH